MAMVVVLGVGLMACGQPGAGSADDLGPYAGGATYPWSDRLDPPGPDPYAGSRSYPWTGVSTATSAQPSSTGVNLLSDLTYTTATNGWGPVEKDASNGGQAAGDGRTLQIGSQTYTRGLGVHASSSLHYTLTSTCTTFSAEVGIDAEVGRRGSVVFQVYGDGTKLYDSGKVNGGDAARPVAADVRGVRDLELRVTNAEDHIYFDHADWADARVTCAAPAVPSGTPFLSDLSPTSATNGWGPVEKDRSNGEQLFGDGRTLTLGGTVYDKGLGMHAMQAQVGDTPPSTLTYALGGRCSTLSAQVGLDDETGGRGSVVFQVYGDNDRVPLYDSGVMTGSATKSVNVDVSGQQELKLVVTDGGDGIAYDHADWANARLNCTDVVEPPPVSAPTSYTYTPIADMPYGVSEAQGEVVGGKLYLMGGFDSSKDCCTPTDRALVFDPAANTWTSLAPMPSDGSTAYGGTTHSGLTTDGTNIYYAGGYIADDSGTGQVFGTRAVWSYNVAANTYARLPDLPLPRAAGQLEYLGGKLYYFGGTGMDRENQPEVGNLYVLDLQNLEAGWIEKTSIPNPRNHLGSAVLGGKIYAIGGQLGHDDTLTTQDTVNVYDPGNDKWTVLAPLPRARSHIANSTFVLDGRVIVAGGETAHNQPMNDVNAYDPAAGTWTALTPLPQARVSGVANALGDRFVFVGGSADPSGGNSAASGWQAVPDLPTP